MTSLVNSYRPTGGVSGTATYALGFTPTVGNTLILWLHMTATANTLTSATLGSGRAFTVHDDVVDTTYSERMYCLSRVVQSGDASSVTLVSSAGNVTFHVVEVNGLLTPEASGFESAPTAIHCTPGALSHSKTFTTATTNDFVFVGLHGSTSLHPFSGLTAGYTHLSNGRSGSDGFYNVDVGAAGSKTFAFTMNASNDPRLHFYLFKAAATDPTVSTVSSNSATEGSTITHTVTLSGATNRSTNYAATLVGVTATGSGTDFTSDLSSATYSAGVTFSGGNMVVPAAVSSFTVTVSTTSDTTDEVDETYTLTVGGVSGTGTITDDDAPPTVSIGDATESFGTVTHTLTLSQASGKTITVQVDSANGSKTAGTHYTAIVAQTVTFLPGETEQTVTVTVL